MGFEPIIFGKTGIQTGRLGIGSSYGVPPEAIEEAFDYGINYFYWGMLRKEKMAEGIRRIVKKDRERAVIVIQTVGRGNRWIKTSLHRGLKRLGIEYADVLLLSWFKKKPTQRTIDTVLELKEKGLIRFIGAASHKRPFFAEIDKENFFDIFHLRYSAAHRGAEKDIFPYLNKDESTGIVSYTATRWKQLLKDRKMPKGEKTPTAVDCYRFVLSNPNVHVCITGPKNLEQLRQNMKVIELGPMNEDELAWMKRVGDYIHK